MNKSKMYYAQHTEIETFYFFIRTCIMDYHYRPTPENYRILTEGSKYIPKFIESFHSKKVINFVDIKYIRILENLESAIPRELAKHKGSLKRIK